MHAYMHASIPTVIATYVRTYVRTYAHTHAGTYMHSYIHTCIATRACMRAFEHAYMHAYMHVCMCVYRVTCTYTHTHICVYLPFPTPLFRGPRVTLPRQLDARIGQAGSVAEDPRTGLHQLKLRGLLRGSGVLPEWWCKHHHSTNCVAEVPTNLEVEAWFLSTSWFRGPWERGLRCKVLDGNSSCQV